MHARLRAVAATDIDSAVADYRESASPDAAVDFVDEFESAISMLTRHPLTGSLRFAYELEISELTKLASAEVPLHGLLPSQRRPPRHLAILHARRDIPAFLDADLPQVD